jgi:hypothetical protein
MSIGNDLILLTKGNLQILQSDIVYTQLLANMNGIQDLNSILPA